MLCCELLPLDRYMCSCLFLTTLQLFWYTNACAFISFLERMSDNITASGPCQGVFWQFFYKFTKSEKSKPAYSSSDRVSSGMRSAGVSS
jgi:hypothetical protein